MDVKSYIQAARLRTLPLSISGIVLGCFLAASEGMFDWKIGVLAIITTISLQVLSNFANDYGDGVKGTDNKDRIGPERALQSGAISPKQMLNMIKITGVITLLLAISLIYISFGKENFGYSLLFFGLGIVSIAAAIKYTMGENAYGYSGFGDIMVFIFFGLLSVCGSYFLFTKELDFLIFLPASSIGLLSAGVLNLNNMRDQISDVKAGKNTLVVKIGRKFAKYYHYFLLITAVLLTMVFILIHIESVQQFLVVISFVPIMKHLYFVYLNNEPKDFDPELKKLALSTLLLSFLLGIGLII